MHKIAMSLVLILISVGAEARGVKLTTERFNTLLTEIITSKELSNDLSEYKKTIPKDDISQMIFLANMSSAVYKLHDIKLENHEIGKYTPNQLKELITEQFTYMLSDEKAIPQENEKFKDVLGSFFRGHKEPINIGNTINQEIDKKPSKKAQIGSIASNKKQSKNIKNEMKMQFSGIVSLYEKEPRKKYKMYIAFCGSNSALDWHRNMQINLHPLQINKNIKVHSGFTSSIRDALNAINITQIIEKLNYHTKAEKGYITDTIEKTYTDSTGKLKTINSIIDYSKVSPQNEIELEVCITGHSLGGALAVICSYFINDTLVKALKTQGYKISIKVYTFGAPPIFDKKSGKIVEETIGYDNIYRIWNDGDIVPSLGVTRQELLRIVKTLFGLEHIGKNLKLYTKNEKIRTINKISNHKISSYLTNLRNLESNLDIYNNIQIILENEKHLKLSRNTKTKLNRILEEIIKTNKKYINVPKDIFKLIEEKK